MTKTVTVRIAALVWPDGSWVVEGGEGITEADAFSILYEDHESGGVPCIVTAELPLPSPVEITGTVEAQS